MLPKRTEAIEIIEDDPSDRREHHPDWQAGLAMGAA
jgi:hypothetical protein